RQPSPKLVWQFRRCCCKQEFQITNYLLVCSATLVPDPPFSSKTRVCNSTNSHKKPPRRRSKWSMMISLTSVYPPLPASLWEIFPFISPLPFFESCCMRRHGLTLYSSCSGKSLAAGLG